MINTCQTEKAKRDYVLLRKALDHNDQQAYAELMSLYRDSIYYMLIRMVKNKDDAEDLTLLDGKGVLLFRQGDVDDLQFLGLGGTAAGHQCEQEQQSRQQN